MLNTMGLTFDMVRILLFVKLCIAHILKQLHIIHAHTHTRYTINKHKITIEAAARN